MNRITKSRHPPTKPLVGGKYIDPAKWGSFVRMRVSNMQFILGVTRHIFRTMLQGRKNSTQWNSISLFLGNHIWLQSMDGLWFAMTACPGPPGIICLKRHRHRNDNRKWLKGGKNLSPWSHSNLEGGSPFANKGIFIQVPQKCKGVRKFSTKMHLIWCNCLKGFLLTILLTAFPFLLEVSTQVVGPSAWGR